MPMFSCFGEAWTFITSLVMGVTMVMGVSAVTSAPSYMLNYYKYVLGDEDAEPKHEKFWQTVLTFYVVVTMVTQTIFEPVNLTTFCCRFSLGFRISASCALMLIELLVILLVPVFPNVSETGAIVALMMMAFVGGVGRAFYENTGYALFGPCPPIMTSGFVIGAAISGLFTSILEIIIKASMSEEYESVKIQSYIYFSIAIAVIVLTVIMYFILSKNSFAKKYVAEFRSKRGFCANIYRKSKKTVTPDANEDEIEDYVGNGVTNEEHSAAGVVQTKEEEVEELTTAELIQSVKLWPVIKKIYAMQFSCFFTYFTSYLLFPGVMLAVDYDDAWYGTIVMAIFNAADLTGRLMCLIKCLWPPRRWVVIGTLLRLLLYPLMILCATHHIPTHAAAYVLTALAGITNGYFATISITYAPESEGINTNGERALAGQATGVCLLFGVSTGSLLQLAVMLKL
ncbi:nucleoside transporter-like [Trypanosoma theileri]|uniref:Nucleoside transporter-like n=1 Tax=Trypanosoma theileri TaxID=67003 RepID=A0A1X0NV38_9TRYP|nr:nucleoside transporter-like [Trypanosoma theileri]ORC88557.1 nucleoside transporter-like [Trypanosoma theileri]